MITQKMISLKLDVDQLEKLDALCDSIGCNRNKLINFFVFQGVSLLQDHYKCALTNAYASAFSELTK